MVATGTHASKAHADREANAMSHNTWIHRLVRPMVEPLVDSPVTPNQVTTLRLIFGLSAAAACMAGGQTWISIGGVLFLISMLLDRADGTLARLSGKKSRFGHRYDLVADAVCNASIFVGLGIGLRDSSLRRLDDAPRCVGGLGGRGRSC